jgi:hypothetical protein
VLLFDVDAVVESTTGFFPSELSLRALGWKWAASFDPSVAFTGVGGASDVPGRGG